MELYNLFYECLEIEYKELERSANYALRRRGDHLKIYFQHSRGATDWKNNLDFPAKPYGSMDDFWFAHRGFLGVWQILKKVIAAVVSDERIRKITVVGYSHGAAMALFCHEYIKFHRPDIEDIQSYGFGCPRVLWGIQSEKVKRRFHGFTVVRNPDDAVTHLPPAALGYRHVGEMINISEKGKYSPIEAHFAENILKELEAYERKRANEIFGSGKLSAILPSRKYR
ncbi:MAG: lipase family protein [Clostridia bacterium]|nr:lipase family protein [Clostridia bacterium]